MRVNAKKTTRTMDLGKQDVVEIYVETPCHKDLLVPHPYHNMLSGVTRP